MRASFVEKLLFSIHTGVSALTKMPELALEQEEAKKMGDAVAGVMAFHKVKMTPKQEAYAILFEAAAEVYPPMIAHAYMAAMMRKQEADKRKPAPVAPQRAHVPPPPPPKPAATVHPFTGANTTGFDPAKIQMPS